MSEARTEIPGNINGNHDLDLGTHAAYLFETNSEKQEKLFEICKECLRVKNVGLLYIAGKQGVKGIRLSLKDSGVDVSSRERMRQLRLVDSEEWYISQDKPQRFKSNEELGEQFRKSSSEVVSAGYGYLSVISETDMLVRKGFFKEYKQFDASISQNIREFKAMFLCAFDKRELLAAGVTNPTTVLEEAHDFLI